MTALPSFQAPPVTEVVIGSRFRPADAYSLVSLADFLALAKDSGFTRVEEQPGYDAPSEQFEAAAERGQISLELLSGPPPTRYWFLNEVGDQLLQVQRNWFAANWRKVAPTAAYGRWDSRWEAFSEWLSKAERTFAGQPLRHEQVEVTYINHIEGGGAWTGHGEASKVFAFLSADWKLAGGFVPEPERVSADLKYVMTAAGASTPLGRLHVTVTPAYKRPSGEPIFVMNLTARGRPAAPDLDGVRQFAELAHEWIVRAFADLTTPQMHEVWQRNDEEGTR